MRKIVVGITVASLMASSVLVSGCGADKGQEAVAPVQTQVVPVKVGVAMKGALDQGRTLTGSTQPSQLVNVVPKVSAKVASIPVKVGQKVQAGDVLFRLDDKDLRHAVEQSQQNVALSRATLAQAQSQTKNGVDSAQMGVNQANSGLSQANNAYEQAQNSMTTTRNGLEQANAQIARAQQGYTDAKVNADRMETLFSQGVVTQQQLEQAKTQLKSAEIALQEAQIAKKNAGVAVKNAEETKKSAEQSRKNALSSLQTAQDQVSNARSGASIEVARQQLKQAELNLKIAQDNLANATVTAPISGTIGAVNGDVGDMASQQSPFVVLANLDSMKAVINAPENLMSLFAIGQSVNVEIPSLSLTTNGRITTISPLNQQAKGYPVTIEVPNPAGKIKGNMVMQIHAVPPTAKRGIVIATSAIIETDGKQYVYVAKGDKAERKAISVIEQNSERTLVSGINEGEKVIVKGQTLISGDVKISVK